MIVEFVGAPGAGKSALRPIAQETLTKLGWPAMSVSEAGLCCLQRSLLGRILSAISPPKWRRRILFASFRRLILFFRLSFIFHNRKLVYQVIKWTLSRQFSWSKKWTILRWFLRDGSYYQFFRKRLQTVELLILDEGLVHRATSLYASPSVEPNRLKIEQYVSLLPRIDLIIWVEAPIELCVARVNARGASRRYLGQDLEPFVTNSANTISMALAVCIQRGDKVIKLDNQTDLNTTIASLQDALVQYGCAESLVE